MIDVQIEVIFDEGYNMYTIQITSELGYYSSMDMNNAVFFELLVQEYQKICAKHNGELREVKHNLKFTGITMFEHKSDAEATIDELISHMVMMKLVGG